MFHRIPPIGRRAVPCLALALFAFALPCLAQSGASAPAERSAVPASPEAAPNPWKDATPTAAGVLAGAANEADEIRAQNVEKVVIGVTWGPQARATTVASVTLRKGKKSVSSPFLAALPGEVTQHVLDATALKDGKVEVWVTYREGSSVRTFQGRTAIKAKSGRPLITNDAVVLGVLMALLAFVFATSSSSSRFWQRFYKIVPSLLLCYFLPSVLTNLGLISPTVSNLYPVARDFLLPSSLVLLTLSIDLPGVLRLGPKALIMFLSGTLGIVIGGPLAILITSLFMPEAVAGDQIWRGLSTVAGSWIGGGANQAAMKEVWNLNDDRLFGVMVAVDVLVANVWMAGLLLIARHHKKLDRRMGADARAIDDLQKRIEDYHESVKRHPSTADLVVMLAVAFGVTALGHVLADSLVPFFDQLSIAKQLRDFGLLSKFFWIVVFATTAAIGLSFTRTRRLEGAGASKVGSVLLYVLVATIGMKMDLRAIFERPELFLVGGIWMAIHIAVLFGTALIIRSPMFFLAVGSKANIGGAASAPIVASAFNPVLAPVGVLLAVVGYALGTYAAWLCAVLMEFAVPA